MSWITRQFGIGVSKKTVASDDVMSAAFGIDGAHVSLVTNAHDAMQRSVWCYRAVATVASRIGSLPWNLYQGEKVVTGKDAVLKRPNPYQTFVEMIEQITAWQMLKGFGILYADPMNLRALDAEMLRNERGSLMAYEGGQWVQIDSKRVVLFPNLSLSGQYGLSELSTIIDAANMDENAKAVWNNQMGSGGVLSGLLSTDTRLSEQELTAIKSKWEERYGGVKNAGTMAFLGAGFKFTQMGISAADMKMLEVSKVTRNEIGAAFGVPGIFLNDTESVDYSNAQTQEKILYSNTVCPRADRIADRINVFLLPLLGLKGLTFKFDYSGIEALQEDKLQRAQIDEIEIRTGKMTINEARERDGLKKVKWGDVFWGSGMLVPISTSEVSEPEPTPPELPVSAPAEAPVVPIEEPKGIKALHTPAARNLIKTGFLAKVASQEKKFAANTMKAFGKQEKKVVAWVESGAKAVVAPKVRALLDDADLIDNWHALYVAFGLQSAEEVAARYGMAVPDGSAILAWIKKQERTHSKYVNDTTADAIDKILSDLRAEGASISDMVKATKEYFGGVGYRAERVARTEVIGVNNYAAQDTYKENGVEKHEWLATDDTRTRDDHAEADGQVRGIDEPFTVGGEQLLYPGDSAGSPEQTCNCRCALLPVI